MPSSGATAHLHRGPDWLDGTPGPGLATVLHSCIRPAAHSRRAIVLLWSSYSWAAGGLGPWNKTPVSLIDFGRRRFLEKESSKKMKKMITAIPREILNDLQYNLIDVKLHQRNVLNRSDFILLNSYSSNEEKVEMLMELMRNKTEEDHENFLEIMEEDYSWLRDKCEIFFQKIRLDSLLKKSNSCTARSPSEKPESPKEKEQPETTEESDRSVQRSSSPDSCVILPGTDKENVPSLHVPPHNKKSENQVGPDMEIFNKKLDQAITSDMMTKVRRNHRVVKRWSTLAHALGMTRVVHTLRMRIIINGEDVDACVLHLLEEWKGTHPKEATLGRLVSALREDGFNDVADELVTTYAA